MKQLNARVLMAVVCIGLGLIFFPISAGAGSCQQWVGQLVSMQGTVETQHNGKTHWQPANLEDTFCPGDSIRIGPKSRAAIHFPNDTILKLDELTTISFPTDDKEKRTLIDILKGTVYFFGHHPTHLKIITPFVNAAIEGTEFFVKVDQDQTVLSIFEGRVIATNELGEVPLVKGQSAMARSGQAPAEYLLAHPRDAVQWALYYPPILDYRDGDFTGGDDNGWQSKIRKSIAFYWKGDLANAFASLAGIPEKINDPRFFVYRAGLLLTVGRVDEAEIDIKKALALDQRLSDVAALESIIAISQNKKEEALEQAARAVLMDEKSTVAHTAMSYARQMHFDLEGALDSARTAVKYDVENALAWARLAELWLSTGNLERALAAAKAAVIFNPNLSRTQTIMGFADLVQVKIASAMDAFQAAIKLDPAAPLPRLGLGLAKIRKGDLTAGRSEIEIAAGLDPGNALIRSYLGKAYFEENRNELALNQLSRARDLDPHDPTPWFYDAIREQSINRPIEALVDLQKSMELNGNRSVYRSRLMLDADLAARSAAIARIYSDLGFQQRALVEGWQSVNIDPTNFSAHRFLADSYSIRPRHEIARVSELLQSQLLQPVNSIPIQPRLAESNLFLLNSGGPADLSFNEFNSLFSRNRTTAQVNGLVGGDDRYSGETIISGLYHKLSLNAGYAHFETDGWRENADQNDDITDIFGQYDLSYKTSIQAEYRYRDVERGDVELNFFADDFLPNLHKKDRTDTFRLGLHHAISPASDLIGHLQYSEADRSDRDSDLFLTRFDVETKEEALGGELEYLLRTKSFNIVTGAGYFKIKADDNIFVDILEEPVVRETLDSGANHANFFLYSYVKPSENLTVTLGGSTDFYDPDDDLQKKQDQFNPKFGILWNPFTNTTIRGAAFRVLKRTLITNQTVEPTQVAGFNQFFDEVNATDYWVYGGAIDQRFNQRLYGGAAFTYRNLDVPYLDETLKNANWDESIARAYIFWTANNWLSLSAEYLYENIERDEGFADGAKNAETHQVPLEIKLFHPSGLSVALKGTYVNQDGSFEYKDDAGFFIDGDDDFFLVDTAIRYRLPKRHGLITIGVKNLTGEEFEYFDSDRKNPRFLPDRSFFLNFILSLP